MGIILSALAAAGDEGIKSIDQQQKIDAASALQDRQAALTLNNEKAMLQAKMDVADSVRQAQATRIDAATQPIVQQGIIAKAQAARANDLPAYDPASDTAGPGAGSFHGDARQALAAIQSLPEGPDKQAALTQLQQNVASNKADVGTLTSDDLTDAERTQFAPSAAELQKARMLAAIQTGDISPKDAATLGQSSELTQMKMDNILERAQDRNQTMQQVADVRADAMKYGYELRLQAAQEKQATGKVDTATTRMLITSEDANIRASTSQLGMINTQLQNTRATVDGGKPNPAYQALVEQMDSLRADIAASKQTKKALFTNLGIQPDDSDSTPSPKPGAAPASPAASAPPSGLPPGLPAGSVQIGTSGGKPVYQTPDGKKFTTQ